MTAPHKLELFFRLESAAPQGVLHYREIGARAHERIEQVQIVIRSLYLRDDAFGHTRPNKLKVTVEAAAPGSTAAEHARQRASQSSGDTTTIPTPELLDTGLRATASAGRKSWHAFEVLGDADGRCARCGFSIGAKHIRYGGQEYVLHASCASDHFAAQAHAQKDNAPCRS